MCGLVDHDHRIYDTVPGRHTYRFLATHTQATQIEVELTLPALAMLDTRIVTNLVGGGCPSRYFSGPLFAALGIHKF